MDEEIIVDALQTIERIESELLSKLGNDCNQSAGMGDHVCKSVCIEEKITGRKVADHRNLVLRFALMTQHN